jgi:uncharacterized repeat protein (TIGR03803 family)
MQSRLHLFLLPALIAGLGLLPAGWVTAQTFTTLHTFARNDGADPWAGLILSGNTLYGTTVYGGSSDGGTVFAVNTDGTGFTNLHTFTATSGPYDTNSDGVWPWAGLVLSGNTLYGTAGNGGSSGLGTVFAAHTDGTGFTNLHSFADSDGGGQYGGLASLGNTLFGTTAGTVFAVNTDGSRFTNLHSFSASSTNSSGVYTNSDGGEPWAGLILSGNTLYGTATSGGSFGNGTVFALNTNGTGFTNLHSFKALIPYYTNSFGDVLGTNSDGANPYAGVILSGNTLYGTASQGGSSGNGTVFAVNTDGTGFTTLHSFTEISAPYTGRNSDGANPWAGLILSGNTLYGTASQGGSLGGGAVFAVNTNGTGFANLYSFAYDGIWPYSGLVLSGNTLYGTASDYGTMFGSGTVFSLSFRPQLTIVNSGPNVILSWPTNVAGFDYTGYTLQSTTNLGSSAVWSTNSPAPVLADGQITVTIPISGAPKFYRLSQ